MSEQIVDETNEQVSEVVAKETQAVLTEEFTTQILFHVNQLEIEEGSTQTLTLVSWPYSRNIISAVLTVMGIPFVYSRASKKDDSFVLDVTPGSLDHIQAILKLVRKQKTVNNGASHYLNDLSTKLVEFLNSNPDKIDGYVTIDKETVDEEADEVTA